MKYLLPLVLCLTGCFHQTWNDTPTPPQPTAPVIIARGTDGINTHSCQVQELNSSLVWIECEFHNTWPAIAGNSTATSCIKISFYDEATGKLVVESRKICSSPLKAGESFTNYAAFIKENRVTLRKCGELLDLCVMLAGPAK